MLDTLEALDADRSGRIEQVEIEDFARSQGLDVEKALAEFRELDIDGSGDLDIQELSGTLSLSADAAQQTQPSENWTSILPTASSSQAAPAAVQPASSLATSRTGPLPFEVAANSTATTPSTQPSLRASAAPSESASPAMLAGRLLAIGSLPSLPHTENASVLLQAIGARSQQLAARATAEVFARQAEKIMEHRSEDEKKAEELQATARRLRQNASALLQSSAALAARAASDAVAKIVAPAAAEVQKIEIDAQRAMDDAATQRSQATQAMERALKAQVELTEKVRRQLQIRHTASPMQ